jgi:hypothetical protein
MAKDITDLLKVIKGLREAASGSQIVHLPSLRETQGFVQDLREGDDWLMAFDTNIGNKYYSYEDRAKIEQALHSVQRDRK